MKEYDQLVQDHRTVFAKLVASTKTESGLPNTPCADPQNDPAWWEAPATSKSGELAKRLCEHHCPVFRLCRRFALLTNPPEGIWGGLSRRERTQVLKRIQRSREAA